MQSIFSNGDQFSEVSAIIWSDIRNPIYGHLLLIFLQKAANSNLPIMGQIWQQHVRNLDIFLEGGINVIQQTENLENCFHFLCMIENDCGLFKRIYRISQEQCKAVGKVLTATKLFIIV